MKKYLQTILVGLALVLAFNSQAQLANGTFAPDITLTDLDGTEYNLYDILDEGKSVILDLYAVWCGPCWNYHTGGTLEEVYTTYGPDGTDEMMVFGIEADTTTPANTIEGGGNSLGNWLEGVLYPMVNDDAIASLYALAYYPTIYTICPNRIITESSQISVADHYAIATGCALPDAGSDGFVLGYTGATESCSDANMSLNVGNMGQMDLVNPTIDWVSSAGETGSYDYSGTIASFTSVEIDLGAVPVAEDITVEFTITGDDATENNTYTQAIGVVTTEATTHLRIDITFDCWSQETGWELKDNDGTILDSRIAGDYPTGTESVSVDTYVPAIGCYSFTMTDSYGDGLNGLGVDGCPNNGTVLVQDVDGASTTTIMAYDGTTPYATLTEGFKATSVVGVEETVNVEFGFNVFPNPTSGNAQVSYGLTEAGRTTLKVTNLLGETVSFEDLGVQPVGKNIYSLDLSSENAGVYFVTLFSSDQIITKKVNLTK